MLGIWLDRLIRRLPFSVRKHYVLPLLHRLRKPELYGRQYNDEVFWESFFCLSRVGDDRSTIAPDFSELNSVFHYNAVENGIIALLQQRRFRPERVLDLGSGTGHWIDFYARIFAIKSIVGVDISRKAVRLLEERFHDRPEARFQTGQVVDVDLGDEPFDLASCVGVLFHIVDDRKWNDTLCRLYECLRPGGLLIASGLFGPFTANVQFEPERFTTVAEYRGGQDRACNKRVRSRRMWRKALRSAGFQETVFQRTPKPRHMNTPENNLLLAVK